MSNVANGCTHTLGQFAHSGANADAAYVPGWHIVQYVALAVVEAHPPMHAPHCGDCAGAFGHPVHLDPLHSRPLDAKTID